MTTNKGHNICINMRLKSADLKRLEEEKVQTQNTTSMVISSAIESGFNLIIATNSNKGIKATTKK